MASSMKTSKHLVLGEIYSRQTLSDRFHIRDASIRNGVFRPKGHDSAWLFVTERKTPDRTPYSYRLTNRALFMDGQTSGRTDYLIEDHQSLGLELLVFYRQYRDQYPEFGFRYEAHFVTFPAGAAIRHTSIFTVSLLRKVRGPVKE